MYSLIAKADYSYEVMKIRDLRTRFIEAYKMTTLDILKGYTNKSQIELKYDFSYSESTKAAIHTIYDYFNTVVIEELKPLVSEKYKTYYDEKYAIVEAAYKEEGLEYPLDDLLYPSAYNKNYNGVIGTAKFRNAVLTFLRDTSESEYWHYIGGEAFAIEYIEQRLQAYIDENFNANDYKINKIDSSDKLLPKDIDVNTVEFDYTNIFNETDDEAKGVVDRFRSDYTTIPLCFCTQKTKNFSVRTPRLFVRIEPEMAQAVIEEALEKAIATQFEKQSLMEYVQNLEAQPITINVNTSKGTWELIDGYKRIFCIFDEALLDVEAPIRVFKDLTDEGFLALLYAANLWKATTKGYNLSFHDRGFLFALRTRYDFNIPLEYYHGRCANTSLGRIAHTPLDILSMYDFRRTSTTTFHGDIISSSNRTRLDKYIASDIKYLDFFDGLQNKSHLVEDIKLFYDTLPKLVAEIKDYDFNILEELLLYIVRTVGTIRKFSNGATQNALTVDMLREVLTNKENVKVFAKKHLSSTTYVENFLDSKGYYDKVAKFVYDELTK